MKYKILNVKKIKLPCIIINYLFNPKTNQMEEQATTPQNFTFDIVHQESYSRGELLLRSFFGFFYIMIPHMFVLFFMYLAAAVLHFIAWWAVLFTGKYPKNFFEFQLSLVRWGTRLNARILNLADGYPAFGTSAEDNKIIVNLVYPEKLSIGLLLARFFFGWIYVGIPHFFCLAFRVIATYFVVFAAWWVVLITGKYPAGMHSFVVGTFRWVTRVSLYLSFMTDEYPPFTGK